MRRTPIAGHPAVRRLTRPVTRQPLRRAFARALATVLWLVAAASPSAQGQTFKALYSFAGYPADGAVPLAGLVMDASGNLYGTTLWGGKYSTCLPAGVGCGTVFKLDTNGTETILHNFNGSDGAESSATLIMDANGDLYGTTACGGGSGCSTSDSVGCGVAFKLSGTKETLLHRFTGGADGQWPWAGLVMDASGVLYGTTTAAGKYGGGVVFKLIGKKETVLHAFTGGWDGGAPAAGTLLDINGDLYGTTTSGGDINCDYPASCGVVFKLAGHKETVLHQFRGSPDGDTPEAAVTADATGNLYSTTWFGGRADNCGTVFEVTAAGKERVLHRFGRQHDGCGPPAGVVFDPQGNLYGTTQEGGLSDRSAGVAYEITVDGKEKILHEFCSEKGCADGTYPVGGLIMDAEGNLYGTTSGGGRYGDGVIFMITP